MITSKGIYYFPHYRAAHDYAESNQFPTDRIMHYGLGWAIQLYVSGPYVGTKAQMTRDCLLRREPA